MAPVPVMVRFRVDLGKTRMCSPARLAAGRFCDRESVPLPLLVALFKALPEPVIVRFERHFRCDVGIERSGIRELFARVVAVAPGVS